jgi:hypothetical protein
MVPPSEGMPRYGQRAPPLGRVPSETYRACLQALPAPIILPRSTPTRGAGDRRVEVGETFANLEDSATRLVAVSRLPQLYWTTMVLVL